MTSSDVSRVKLINDRASLFVYGTLRDRRVQEALFKKHLDAEPAVASGIIIRTVRENIFPVALRGNPVDQVNGAVVRNLTSLDIEIIDFFEDDRYRVEIVETTQGQQPIYIDQSGGMASEKNWSLEEFSSVAGDYIQNCKLVRQRFFDRSR